MCRCLIMICDTFIPVHNGKTSGKWPRLTERVAESERVTVVSNRSLENGELWHCKEISQVEKAKEETVSCRSYCSFMDPRLLIYGRILKGWSTKCCKERAGEQGGALMPALFSLGQNDALVAIQGRLAQDERFMAFLDHIYAVGDRPERSGAAYTAIQEELWTHTGIEVHQGKTQLWNRAGVAPAGSAALTAAARVADPSAVVWRGDPHLPTEEQGVKILGTPLGHPSYVRSQLVALSAMHEHLMSNTLQVQDSQCAWILLLLCVSVWAKNTLRVVHPKLTDAFAAQHDASIRRALSQLLSVDPSSMHWDVASLPFTR